MKKNDYQLLAANRNVYRVVLLLILTSLILSSFGCFGERKEQAKDLVKSGTTKSDRLAKYYSQLKEMRQAHLELTKFELRRANTQLKPTLVKAYTEQFSALDARANMARKLDGTYKALGKLIDYDAPGEISTAVIDLKKALEDVSKKKLTFPDGVLASVDPEVILKKSTNALVTWIQIRQFKRNALKAEDVLDGISKLFNAEKPIYIQIAQDYYKITKTHNQFMLRNDQMNTVSRFNKYAEVYGMELNPMLPPQPPLPPPPLSKINQTEREKEEYVAKMRNFENEYKNYEKEYKSYVNYLAVLKSDSEDLLIDKLNNFTEASVKEADSIDNELFALKKAHQDFMIGKKLNL